jgi:hypothetical protein
MNFNDMMKLAERGHEFIRYMKDFYCLDAGGIYGEEFQFTEEEIVEGINQYFTNYFKNEACKREFLRYGADTVDRERVRDIILTMREVA